jgi:hypothetical protein
VNELSNDRTGSISRREFVIGSALAGIGLAVRPSAGADAAEADWFDRPMRWAQLTLW